MKVTTVTTKSVWDPNAGLKFVHQRPSDSSQSKAHSTGAVSTTPRQPVEPVKAADYVTYLSLMAGTLKK